MAKAVRRFSLQLAHSANELTGVSHRSVTSGIGWSRNPRCRIGQLTGPMARRNSTELNGRSTACNLAPRRYPRKPVPIHSPHRTAKSHKAHKTLGQRLQTELRLEHVLYVVILLVAVLTRFWDLGSRALHHDESLHSYFSWIYASGNGYIHDPLMHGPFLFHATALMYLLFGATAAVSRITPALARRRAGDASLVVAR